MLIYDLEDYIHVTNAGNVSRQNIYPSHTRQNMVSTSNLEMFSKMKNQFLYEQHEQLTVFAVKLLEKVIRAKVIYFIIANQAYNLCLPDQFSSFLHIYTTFYHAGWIASLPMQDFYMKLSRYGLRKSTLTGSNLTSLKNEVSYRWEVLIRT